MTTYTPAETVERSGFTIETLRYYERIGLLRDIDRDPSGRRRFNDGDLAWLEVLRCLRDTGMPIAQMQRYADLTLQGGSVQERLEILRAHDRSVSEQMREMRRWQQHLRGKIDFYEGQLEAAGDDLARPRASR